MGTRREPQNIKLITGLIFKDENIFLKAKTRLEGIFRNPVDCESEIFNFTHTDYYKNEFGEPLKRKFLSFKKKVDPEKIWKIKIKTNRLEGVLSNNARRMVNIDPGYITLSRFVLFSTKDYTHRIYLGDGIYGESALYYKDGTFNPWPWTYPDYKSREYIDFFNDVRNELKTNREKP